MQTVRDLAALFDIPDSSLQLDTSGTTLRDSAVQLDYGLPQRR